MPDKKKDTNPKSLLQKFADIFSISSETTSNTDRPVTITHNNLLSEYAQHETSVLIRRTGVKDENAAFNSEINSRSIIQALFPIHKELVGSVADAERLKSLDTSLKQVENIIVSSIMSPNDLQDRDPTISFEHPELTEAQKKDCDKLFTEFYCNEYKLRARMEKWVKEAHFRSGAGVTLILPEATLASLIATYDPDRTCIKRSSTECFSTESINLKAYNDNKIYNELNDQIYTEEMYNRILSYDPYKKDKKSKQVGKEGIEINKKHKENNDLKLNQESKNIAKIVYNELLEENFELYSKSSDIDRQKLLTAVEDIALKINTTMSQKKPSMISKNPEILRFSKNFKEQMENQIKKNVLNVFDMIDTNKSTYNKKHNYVPVIDLSEHLTTYKEQKAYPFSIDVPTEATIPVCVPGNKKEHLGYLLLVDKYGNFIEASNYLVGDNNCSISGRINNAYTAMYGNIPTQSGIRSPQGSFMGLSEQMIANQQYQATQKIFNYILDNTLRNTVMECTGLDDVSLGTYQSIAICMLSRLLEKKETILVYVPKKYITYLAFDYKANGTGKSKLDDILFLESLKVSMMVSNVLATMKNAVPFRKATLELSKEQRNPQNVIMALRNAIAERERILPSINPTVVSQQILAQNTSVEVRGENQTTGFQFSVQDDKRDLPTIDTDFLDKLDNQTITGLGAPISAVNEIAEVQYAKSVATTNIFFAKTISRDQDIVEEVTENHVKVHASFSSLLISQLAAIIEKTDVKSGTSTDEINKEELIKQNDTVIGIISKKLNDETYTKVLSIIDSIKITLPAPIVSPDTAHYELMDQAIKLVNDYVEAVFPDDLIPSEYSDDLSNTYKSMKAHIKSNAQRELSQQLGMGGALDLVPSVRDYQLTDRVNLISMLADIRGMFKSIQLDQNQRKLTTEDSNMSDSGGSDYNF